MPTSPPTQLFAARQEGIAQGRFTFITDPGTRGWQSFDLAVDSTGLPSFQALQHRSARTDHQIVYYAFDAPHLDGTPLAHLPLEAPIRVAEDR